MGVDKARYDDGARRVDDRGIRHREAGADLANLAVLDQHVGRGKVPDRAVKREHDAAADRYGDASRPLFTATALEAAAGELVAAGHRGQARAAFTRAVEIYASLGAAADVARLQATFRAHGIRRGPRSKHRQARSGWDSLTPAETKIAALVGEGLSNPEIAAKLLLSRRTVATHVSHILKKLDVHSRTDIAREAALRTIAQR